jgi:hypothetical protein
MDMGNTLLRNQPAILVEQELRKPEFQERPFENFVNFSDNYKSGDVPLLNPVSQPRNPNVDMRQFNELANMKNKF